jgi:hypothetical protein
MTLTMKPEGTCRLAFADGALGPVKGVGLGVGLGVAVGSGAAAGCTPLPPPLHAVSAQASNAAPASERRSR